MSARREVTGEPDAGYGGRRVLVAGAGMAGAASARVLLRAGAEVTVVDSVDGPGLAELRAAGVATAVGDGTGLLAGVTDVVVSPGFPPHHPLAVAAASAGLDVYSEPELAWR
ncbi:MAG: UDP-N-acetylmuramoylalanine--D-glutamate ligase, partial [Micromonosporaceae bacterium]|nr:UDP-N-acetylmuramoylalanine--D-glutamate ligase [Micromonosporaceae bacterium]